MTPEDTLRMVRRYWTLILACVIAGVALAGVYCLTRTPRYRAEATAYVVAVPPAAEPQDRTPADGAYSSALLAQQKARAWVELAGSTVVAQRVVDQLHLRLTPQQLTDRITPTLTPSTPMITIAAEAGSARTAQQVADAVVVATGREIDRIEGSRAQAQIRLVSPAALPTGPSWPRPGRLLPLGAVLGGIAGMGLAYTRRRLDTRLRTAQDVQDHAGASVLAVVPTTASLAGPSRSTAGAPGSFQSREALRRLRTNLRYVDVDHAPRSIVVTSARTGEGKSTTAANLARVLAEGGETVLLIDADLRRPSVARIFDLDPAVGLTQVLAGAVTLDSAVQRGDVEGLSVLTAGQLPPNPSELLGSRRMEELISRATRTSMVVIDAPPLLPVTDAALVTAHADGALIVVAARQTRQEHLDLAVQALHNVGGRVLGTVLNRVDTSRLGRALHGEDGDRYEAYEQDPTDLTHRRAG